MTAELKLTFNNTPQNLLNIIQVLFPTNNVPLINIINNTAYKNRPILHNCFVHGFQAVDSTLLFQITGHELVIQIELPPTNNLFVALKTKVNSYNQILINYFKNNNIDTSKINQEVIISTEDSYILVGKIPNRNKEFSKELENNKLRLLIIPITILLLNIGAKKLGWISNIESIVSSSISTLIAIIIWYIVEYLTFSNDDKTFKFQPIN